MQGGNGGVVSRGVGVVAGVVRGAWYIVTQHIVVVVLGGSACVVTGV